MKKVILPFIIFITLLNCSSNEEAPQSQSIVGTWKYAKRVHNGTEDPLSSCQKMNYAEIFSNKTFKATHFKLINNECKSDDISQGIWKENGSSKFLLNVGGTNRYLTLLDFNTMKLQESQNDDSFYEIWKRQ